MERYQIPESGERKKQKEKFGRYKIWAQDEILEHRLVYS